MKRDDQTKVLEAQLAKLTDQDMLIVPKWGIGQMLRLSQRIDQLARTKPEEPSITITAAAPSRTDAQVIEQADQLAEHFATVVMGYNFDDLGHAPMRAQVDPRLRMCWRMACEAMIVLQATDPNDALSATEEN